MKCGYPGQDPEDFARAYLRWRGPLLQFLRRRLGNSSDAEDVAQESFARLVATPAGPLPDKQGPYIYRIAVNLLRDEHRKRSTGGRVAMNAMEDECDDVDRTPDHAGCCATVVEHRQRLSRLEAALAELPDRQREAFVLYRFDGLTQAEVAECMGISRRMAVKHLGRALAYCEQRVRYSSALQMKQHLAISEATEA
ncbi:sigma-70 family RNA polymerase sigma factor [Variovorax sp.]|uniref:RNA polymerase sigma factor n=1 Tax=Variovorax sp. TaxID=1871043 RepID=UPI002D41F4D0|nr:sigma-70 family RNA polymerase sigma factor [Variovorax sp.]HYP85448.1 sigma-70 family RNA polymerase sigma factor [Variovorax sp.]